MTSSKQTTSIVGINFALPLRALPQATVLLFSLGLMFVAVAQRDHSGERGILIQSAIFTTLREGMTNDPYNELAQEVLEPSCRNLLAQVLNVQGVATMLEKAKVAPYGIEIHLPGLDDDKVTLLEHLLTEYLHSRLSGHSLAYARDSLKQRLTNTPPETNVFRLLLFKRFPEIPRNWVRDDPFEPTGSLATQRVVQRVVYARFVVIDGSIAWHYMVLPELSIGTGEVTVKKVDAQEFDPTLRPSFDAATRQAKHNLEQQGIKRGLRGYAERLWREEDAILLRDYGIKRKNFQELNPKVIVD